MRRLVFLFWLILALSPVHAQSGWSAWLLTADKGRMTLVNSGGFVEDFILPLPPGFDRYDFDSVYQMDVAPDGKLFAYLVLNSQTSSRQLMVYNHDLKAIIATYDLTGVGADTPATPVFSDDSKRLAIGYGLNSGWEIVLVDLTNFSILTDLRSDDPEAVSAQLVNTAYASVSWIHEDDIAFSLYGSGENSSYIWNTLNGVVTPAPVDTVYPPTGEQVAGVYDSDVASNPEYRQTANTLQAYDPTSSQRYTFFADPGAWLLTPRFVSNGAAVAMLRYKASLWAWLMVDRAGEVLREFEPEVTDVAGTADGYLYIKGNQLYESTGSEDRLIYEGTQPMSISWVGNLGGFPLLTAQQYIAWGSSSPVSSPPVVAAASPTPDETVLREGVTAIVNTTGGDSLNVRTDAGVNYQIRKKLPRGTEVTVLEGPVEADGFNWWHIQEKDGVEGWVVDYADGVLTLVPSAAFGNNTVNTEAAANPSMESLLQVGDTALVTLSNRNDALRLRNGAGLTFRIVSLLPSGARVVVVDGPRVSDKLTWWQVRTSEGNVGWAAEIIGSERAMTKDDRVPRVTPTPTVEGAPTPTYAPPTNLIPPLLVSPLPESMLTNDPRTVKLSWSPVPYATGYTLEIEGCAGSLENCTPLQTFPDLTATTYELTTTADGLYRWRITATDGSRTSKSDWWSFMFRVQ